MTLLLLYPSGGAQHTGEADITLQAVGLAAVGVHTILGELSITLNPVTMEAVIAEIIKKRPVPQNATALIRQYEKEQEMKLSQKLLQQLKESQSINKEMLGINLELSDKISTIAEQHKQAREVAQAALEANIQLLKKVSSPSPVAQQIKQPLAVSIYVPQPTFAEMKRKQQQLDNLKKAREAKALLKQKKEELRQKRIQNLTKARRNK